MTTARFPFDPIERLVVTALLEREVPEKITARRIATYLGEDGQLVARARRSGLTFDQAERVAVAAGYHPLELWPEMLHRPCALDTCDDTFIPVSDTQIYCSARHRNTAKLRRYRTQEGAREAHRLRQAKYRSEGTAARSRRSARRTAGSVAA